MLKFAREAPNTSLELVSLARPFSCFDAVDHRFKSLFFPMRRIFSLARACGVSTLAIETLDPGCSYDLTCEQDDIAKRRKAPIACEAIRLSFFDRVVRNEGELGSVEDGGFLGYAIAIGNSVDGFRVFEAVMRMPARDDAFVRGMQVWACRVGEHSFRVSGYLYAQQNNCTNVCAHVACRTAAAKFHPDGDMTYREMNDLLGIDHVAKLTGSGVGLTADQMCKILEKAGARCEVGAYPASNAAVIGPPFQRLIYGSIESGYPAIVCFSTEGGSHHAIPVFGHTFNPDLWVHCAEFAYFKIGSQTSYVPSDLWLGAYISHDDNWGPNYCIPQHFLHTRRQCKTWPGGARQCAEQADCVICVIATLPAQTQVTSPAAEAMGMDFLSIMLPEIPDWSEVWKHRLLGYKQANLLVLRPLLIRGNDYLEHLRKMVDWDGSPISKQAIAGLASEPEFADRLVWMVELSVPELFSTNRRKIGEILIRADRAPSKNRDPGSYILARVPGHFATYKGESNYKFVQSGAQGHVPLFGCERQ